MILICQCACILRRRFFFFCLACDFNSVVVLVGLLDFKKSGPQQFLFFYFFHSLNSYVIFHRIEGKHYVYNIHYMYASFSIFNGVV